MIVSLGMDVKCVVVKNPYFNACMVSAFLSASSRAVMLECMQMLIALFFQETQFDTILNSKRNI